MDGEVFADQSLAVQSQGSAASESSRSTQASPEVVTIVNNALLVALWTPTWVAKVRFEFLKPVKPERDAGASQSICSAMQGMGSGSVREFQALSPQQLVSSRQSWIGVTDAV